MNHILNYDHDSLGYTTMSIASLGPSTLSNNKNQPKNSFISNPSETFGNSTVFQTNSRHCLNDVSDIDGAQPKGYRERNYVSKGLYIADIEGTKAKIHDKFLWTKRQVDPLNPSYPLPSVELAPPDSPKFLRDNISVDDIPGARTKQRSIIPGRDPLFVDDIEGSRSGWKPRHM